jgi:hypothetical protein
VAALAGAFHRGFTHSSYWAARSSAAASGAHWDRWEATNGRPDPFFDPETIAILKGVLDEAWSLPAGQSAVTQSLLAERILKAAMEGERDPDRLRTHAITDGNEGTM